jgi:predicted metal-dependent phosphoesterase TrpH
MMIRTRDMQQSIRSRVLAILLPAFGRLALTFIVITIIAVPSLLIYNSPPYQYNYNAVTIDYANPFEPGKYYQPFDAGFNYTVLLDAHVHTDVGGGQMSPETTIQWHIANGYNAMVITDHNDIQRAFDTQKLAREKYDDKIKVLVGEEWSNCRMHMGLLGLKEFVPIPKYPTDLEIQQVINTTHAQGGIVVVNHIPWSYYAGLKMPSSDDLVKWGVDYFDVTTADSFDLQTLFYARAHNCGVLAASDIHQIQPAWEWTLLNPTNFSEESILEALKSRKTSFFFDELGHNPQTSQAIPPQNKEYTAAIPWLLAGKLFHSFYWRKDQGVYSFVDGFCGNDVEEWVFDKTAVGVSLAWVLIMWLLLEIVFGLTRFVVLVLYRKCKGGGERYYHDDDVDTPLLDLWKK